MDIYSDCFEYFRGCFFRYYNSLPPVTKAYGTLCLLTTALCQLGLLDPLNIALYYPWVLKNLQVPTSCTFSLLICPIVTILSLNKIYYMFDLIQII